MRSRRSYCRQAVAHVGIGYRETGLVDGLLKHQVDDSFKPLLRVYGEVRHLLHQLREHLGRQFIQDAAHLPEQILRQRRENKTSLKSNKKQHWQAKQSTRSLGRQNKPRKPLKYRGKPHFGFLFLGRKEKKKKKKFNTVVFSQFTRKKTWMSTLAVCLDFELWTYFSSSTEWQVVYWVCLPVFSEFPGPLGAILSSCRASKHSQPFAAAPHESRKHSWWSCEAGAARQASWGANDEGGQQWA